MSTEEASPVIVVFPRGQLSADDKERMEAHGILCVEADSPKDVCQLQLTAPLFTSQTTGDAFVMAALEARGVPAVRDSRRLHHRSRAHEHEFVQRLAAAIKGEGDAR